MGRIKQGNVGNKIKVIISQEPAVWQSGHMCRREGNTWTITLTDW